jgi:LPXTG-motif cell wall-anchored protein
MIKGPLVFLGLLALALAALFAVPALASAHPVPPTCHEQCVPSWHPSHPASHPASPSALPSATTAMPPTTGPTVGSTTDAPTSAPAEPGTPTPSLSAGALPVTGAKTDIMAGTGLALLLVGTGGLVYGLRRRDRVRFEA